MIKQNFRIGIIGGLGKMGGLFVRIFEKNGYQVLVADIKTKLTNKELVKKSEVVIVAVPIDQTVEVINLIAPFLKPEQLLMDLTSLKEEPLKAMLKSKSAVIGLHPMFNDTSYGPGQTVIICPKRPKKWLPWLKQFLTLNELTHYQLTARQHDEMMSIVQGLVHFAEISFARTLQKLGKKAEEILPFAGPASALKIEMAARIMAQSPELYGLIQTQNPRNKMVLAKYLEANQELAEIAFKKDLKKFIDYFKESAQFLGDYKNKALQESDWIIAQLLEKRRRLSKKAGLAIDSQQFVETRRWHVSTVAVLGPKFSFTDIVSEPWMEKNAIPHNDKFYYHTIDQVFSAVEKGQAQFGIVPIENSLHGTVRDTFDQLFFANVQIAQELHLPIHHCLAVFPGAKKSQIVAVMSHSQALSQCSAYLKKYFPEAELVELSSTAAAMKKLSEERHSHLAVIGSKEAAEAYNLQILAENIENNHDNVTHFIVISKKENPSKFNGKISNGYFSANLNRSRVKPGMTMSLKTSIAFYFGQNKPGILFSVFKDFAEANINLTRIESRPTRKEFGDYIFYLDFAGRSDEPKVKKVLAAVKKKVAMMKVLGTYFY